MILYLEFFQQEYLHSLGFFLASRLQLQINVWEEQWIGHANASDEFVYLPLFTALRIMNFFSIGILIIDYCYSGKAVDMFYSWSFNEWEAVYVAVITN